MINFKNKPSCESDTVTTNIFNFFLCWDFDNLTKRKKAFEAKTNMQVTINRFA